VDEATIEVAEQPPTTELRNTITPVNEVLSSAEDPVVAKEELEPTSTPAMITETPEPSDAEMIKACREAMPDYSEDMMSITEEWDIELSSLAIMFQFTAPSLSEEDTGEVLADFSGSRFEELRTEAGKVEPPACLAEHHQRYLAGMDIIIELLENFENRVLPESDATPLTDSINEMTILVVALATYEEDSEWFFDNLEEITVEAIAQWVEEIAAMEAEAAAAEGPSLEVRVTFTPEGHRLVTLSEDDIYIWDAEGGEQTMAIEEIPAGNISMDTFTISPDGRFIATPGCSGVCIWDANIGDLVSELTGAADVWKLVFSPDSKNLVAITSDTNARLYDVESGQELLTLEHNGSMEGADFSPDGQRLVTHSIDGTTRVWDAGTGEQLLMLGPDSNFDPSAFVPDGNHVVTVNVDGTVRIWDVYNGQLLRVFPNLNAEYATLSPDGNRLATEENYKVHIWDVATGDELIAINDPTEYIQALAFSPDGTLLASGGSDDIVSLWDTETGQVRLSLTGHTDGVESIVFSPDSKLVATGSEDKTARIWDAETGEELMILTGHEEAIKDVAFSSDGHRFATASWDWTARVWDVDTGEELLVLGEPDGLGMVGSVAFNNDGSRIVTGAAMDVVVFDAITGDRLTTIPGRGSITSAAFIPDHDHVATVRFNSADIWEVESGNRVQALSERINANEAAFTPDGTRIVTTGCDDRDENWDCHKGIVRIWDTDSGEELLKLEGHTDEVYGLDFSPDGGQLVTVSEDKTARIWDIESGEELMAFVHEQVTGFDHLWNTSFGLDGDKIITKSSGGLVTVWNAKSGEMLYSLDDAISVDLNSDGTQMVVGNSHGKASIWDIESGEMRFEIEIPVN
jgi:WD40 repeat protein